MSLRSVTAGEAARTGGVKLHAGTKLQETVLIVEVISDLILLTVRPRWVRTPLRVLVVPAEARPCAPSCALLPSVKTQRGEKQPASPRPPPRPLLALLASANLRKYNHSLLPQLPAELQTEAVGRRAVQTLQRAAVSAGTSAPRCSFFCPTALKSEGLRSLSLWAEHPESLQSSSCN